MLKLLLNQFYYAVPEPPEINVTAYYLKQIILGDSNIWTSLLTSVLLSFKHVNVSVYEMLFKYHTPEGVTLMIAHTEHFWWY